MVKGVSKQVIVLQSPNKDLFDQAIFILKDSASSSSGVTDEALLSEARRLMNDQGYHRIGPYRLLWVLLGSAVTAILWLLCSFL